MRIWISMMLLSLGLGAGELTVEQLFNVKTVTAKQDVVKESRHYFGSVEVDPGRVYDVSLRFGGYVGRVAVDAPYTRVKKGEKLFDIYSPELFLAASELLNTLGGKRPELRASIVRKLRLLGVDRRVIDRIIAAKKVEEYLPVYAPATGIVTAKKIVNGSSVKAGERLYEITDLDRLWVIAKVYESDLAFVKEGMTATVHVDGRDVSVPARVERIYPDVKKTERSVSVRLVVENGEGLFFPGAFATVELSSPERTALVVPGSAVITKGERFYVFIAGEYEGEYEPVRIGARRLADGRFEVLSGLKEGDRVVNDSLFLFDSDAQLNGLY